MNNWTRFSCALMVLVLAGTGSLYADHCSPQEGQPCLQDGRFEVVVDWKTPTAEGRALAVPISEDSIWFWFFSPTNVELLVKVLDGRALNDHFWVFAAALSNVELELSITDLETGVVRDYQNPAGEQLTLADTRAFLDLPPVGGGSSSSNLVSVTSQHGEEIDPDDRLTQAASHARCVNRRAFGFPCRSIDLQALLPLDDLSPRGDASGSDLWGWTDPATGREYALMGLSDGTTFVDISEAAEPRVLGHLATHDRSTPWRDIKTYRNHAFVVADGGQNQHGMQVFDLRRLRGRARGLASLGADAVYSEFGPAHNVAIDETAGFAYAVGTDTCSGGLHMVDIRQPESPTFAGCFGDDGYTHDVQCVTYRGPDLRYRDHQICFAANEDTLTIVDTTSKSNPTQLSRTGYAGVGYAHQGWLTENSRFFLLDDEGDEGQNGHGTRTYIWNVSDLEQPFLSAVHQSGNTAADHNQYVYRGYSFQANYRSGLRILDTAKVGRGRLTEVAFFDIVPADNQPRFSGAWSVYPFFESGNVIVSGIGEGLVVLRPLLPGFGLPEAPSDLEATAMGTTVELVWTNNCHHEEGVRVFRSGEREEETLIAELPPGTSSFLDRDLDPLATYVYRVAAFEGEAQSEAAEVSVTTDPQPSECLPASATACVNGERFSVSVVWETARGEHGVGGAATLTSEASSFWFFSAGNIDLVVKVIDGRAHNNHFWVFTGSLSDVIYTVTVTDTETGRVRRYVNQQGTLRSIADTNAFRGLV